MHRCTNSPGMAAKRWWGPHGKSSAQVSLTRRYDKFVRGWCSVIGSTGNIHDKSCSEQHCFLAVFQNVDSPSSICSFLRDGEGVKTLSHTYRNESKQQLIPPPTKKKNMSWVKSIPNSGKNRPDKGRGREREKLREWGILWEKKSNSTTLATMVLIPASMATFWIMITVSENEWTKGISQSMVVIVKNRAP